MQNLEIDEDHFEEIQDILYDARQYLHRFNFSNPKFRALRDQCKNHHELCGLWAVLGECHNNPLFMNTTCAPVCQSCEFLLPEFRCPIDPNEVDAWYPGDVNAMFERIIIQPAYVKYEPHILSSPQRPSYDALDSSSKRGPWILQLDQFLSDEEADRLIELGIDTGFQPSYTALGSRPDGSLDAYADTSRTSSSTYCDSATCLQDPTIQSVIERLEQLTHVPESHYEHFHMLRYDVGQFFDTHSDFLYQHRNRQEGVRIFSVLMYLNDVNEGGTTRFKHMNLTIAPKRGRAVVWPSVLDGDPNSQDNRTDHESMPVLQGTKYGAYTFMSLFSKTLSNLFRFKYFVDCFFLQQ
jgi:prolyl 4-hydroxylase